jgi:hypothetical protein
MNVLQRHLSPPLALWVRGLWRMRRPAPEAAPCCFDAALAHCMRQDYAQAFDVLARLADDGHVPAARIALLMATQGTRLYGHRFGASTAACRRWQALADTTVGSTPLN